jgi:hypothetical protein
MGRRHRYVAWAGVVACSGFLLTSIVLLADGIREWQVSSASANWPTAQATVERDVPVKQFPPPRFGIVSVGYEHEISVRYVVSGAEYTTNLRLHRDTAIEQPKDSRRDAMERTMPVEHVVVYYNPQNPREVVLHPGDFLVAGRAIEVGGMTTLLCASVVLLIASRLLNTQPTDWLTPSAKRR